MKKRRRHGKKRKAPPLATTAWQATPAVTIAVPPPTSSIDLAKIRDRFHRIKQRAANG